MNISGFKKEIRGTAACIKRTTRVIKGCGKMLSNRTFFADSCFSGLNTDKETNV